MALPQVIILSTQRSGTHLLESLLKCHPRIAGRGELFLRFKRSGILEENEPNKLNVGILMYSEIPVFLKLSETTSPDQTCQIIHLLRDPRDIALSRLQMELEKAVLGTAYKAHYLKGETKEMREFSHDQQQEAFVKRKLSFLKKKITNEQTFYKNILKKKHHLEIHYEDIAPNNQSIEMLNNKLQNRILTFLDLKNDPITLYTNFIKTS